MKQPNENDFLKRVGKKAECWKFLRKYLSENYSDHEPVLSIGKREFDWTIRYRKSGKTLVTLSPEENDFSVLVILGEKEINLAREIKLSANVQNVFNNSKKYHDGMWIFLRLKNNADIESVKKILAIKRKPKQI
ncbi:MAG: DUF3788 family protein [bacterium]|nr:DUF3788 family protein [bacterium]